MIDCRPVDACYEMRTESLMILAHNLVVVVVAAAAVEKRIPLLLTSVTRGQSNLAKAVPYDPPHTARAAEFSHMTDR